MDKQVTFFDSIVTQIKSRKPIELALVFVSTVYFCIVLNSVNYPYAIFPLLIISFLALMGFGFKKCKVYIKDILLFIILFVDIVYFFQFITLVDISDKYGILYLLSLLSKNLLFMTIPLILGAYLLVRPFCSLKLTAIIVPIPFALLTVTDFYVTRFRGNEITFSDFRSIGTAMNVAGNYTYNPVIPIALIAVPYILTVIIARNLTEDKSKRNIGIRITMWIGAVASVLIFLGLTINFFKYNAYTQFGSNGSFYNTFYINFTESIFKSIVTKPENYNLDDLNIEDRNHQSVLPEDAPNIIVIMNESYTDMSVYSEFPSDIANPDPYWDSLTENTIHGYALSSVFGGNTANSEFEFLTGLSMINLPEESVAYNQYIDEDIPSLPRLLNSLGYSSAAMHPYKSSGWRRTIVYPLLGFDDMYFDAAFTADEDDYLRNYLSDRCAYENLLRFINDSDNELNFYFLITIQNHSPFLNSNNGSYIPGSYITDPEYESLNNFLSLTNESDNALEYLFSNLSTMDDRYLVLVFGDHQPQFNFTETYSNPAPGGNRWVIPYLIWANYDINPELIEELDHTEDYTSINYLSLDLLTVAGIEPDSYYDLLYRIREEVPCINSVGYRLAGEDEFRPRDDLGSNRMLQLYSYLTYDVLFDGDDSTFTEVN